MVERVHRSKVYFHIPDEQGQQKHNETTASTPASIRAVADIFPLLLLIFPYLLIITWARLTSIERGRFRREG